MSIEDIVSDGPRTTVAAERIKRLLGKASHGTAQALREILIQVASETAKRQWD